MSYSKILGTGGYLPERILTNAELAETVDTSDEWIRARTGVHQRHVAAADETASSMAEQASLRAIDSAGINADQVGMIVVASSSGDRVFPSTACMLQERLGIRGGPAFDVQAACSGFIYALTVADKFVASGSVDYALVVGSEVNSRILDWQDRGTCVIFGDGAGAVVIGRSETPGILSTHIGADGSYKDLLYIPNPLKDQKQLGDDPHMRMMGSDVFKVAVRTLGKLVVETLDANGLQKSDIDWLIPHQANIRIIDAMAKKLDMPKDKVVVTIAEQGNTSAASVPLALDQAVRDGRIQVGHRVLLEAFGGGFAWGAVLFQY